VGRSRNCTLGRWLSGCRSNNLRAGQSKFTQARSLNYCTSRSPLMIFPIKNMALVSAAKRTATLSRTLSEEVRSTQGITHPAAEMMHPAAIAARRPSRSETWALDKAPKQIPIWYIAAHALCHVASITYVEPTWTPKTRLHKQERQRPPPTRSAEAKLTRRRAWSSTGSLRLYQNRPSEGRWSRRSLGDA
jgi:hypothetical protein